MVLQLVLTQTTAQTTWTVSSFASSSVCVPLSRPLTADSSGVEMQRRKHKYWVSVRPQSEQYQTKPRVMAMEKRHRYMFLPYNRLFLLVSVTSSLTVLHSARVGLFAHIFCTDQKRLFPLSAKSHSGKSELYWTALKLRCDWLGAGPECRLVNCMRAPSTGDTFTWQREWHNTTLFKIIRKHQNTSYLRKWYLIGDSLLCSLKH